MPYNKSKNNQKIIKKQIKSIVREQLDEELESKHAITDYPAVSMKSVVPSGVVLNGQGNFFKILPEIQQSTTGNAGAAYNERIGNNINLKEIDIHGYLSYNGVFASQVNLEDAKLAVRVMILRAKEANDSELLFDNMPTDVLLRFGTQTGSAAGATPYDGFPLASFRDINRDAFSVKYDKVHYLNASVFSPGTTSTDLSVVPSGLKIFRHKLRFGKNGIKLQYSTQADTSPNNFPYFMVVGYSSMSGTTKPQDNLIKMTLSCVCKYTDA